MKKAGFLLTFMILLCFSAVCVSAAERISCTVTAESVPCRVNIIMAEKEDFEPDDIVGFETRVFNTKGEHEVLITPRNDTESGEYILIIKNNDKKEVRSVYYISAEELAELLESINAASKTELDAMIEESTGILGISDSYKEYYSHLTPMSREKIAEELSETDFTSVSDFKVKFRELSKTSYDEEEPLRTAVGLINDSSGDIADIINTYGRLLGFDIDNIYGWAMVKDTQYVSFVAQALNGKNFAVSDIDAIEQAFNEGCEIAALNCADYIKLEKVINSYNDLKSKLNMSYYNSLHADDKTAVMRTVASNEYRSIEDFITSFNAEILKYTPHSSNNTGGSGTGGGGGGGSSSSKGSFGTGGSAVSLPNVSASETNQDVFNDLESCPWAKEAIYALKKKGIVSGRGDNSFVPDAPTTRAEFTAMLVRALGVYDAAANADFDDVSADDWSYRYIASAKQAGLINGRSEHIFGADDNIIRYEAAIMAYNAMTALGYEFTSYDESFNDTDKLNENSKAMISALSASGVINGTGDGMFEPYAGATRAQTAVIIYRILSLTGGAQ